MPELPEVETICSNLREKILAKPIDKIKIILPKIIKSNPVGFQKELSGNTIQAISRRGKLIIWDLKKGDKKLLIHLRMTGQLVYCFTGAKSSSEYIVGGHSWPTINSLPHKHTHAIFYFQDGSHLYFNDQRQFGYLKLVDKSELHSILRKYGIEPLTPDFTLENLQRILQGRSKSIKAVLLDQSLIAGLGNIYADEVCWAAGIHPTRLAKSLKREELKKIHIEIEQILRLAITERGTTFSNFVDAEGRSGNFINLIKVYGRAGKECFHCHNLIEKIRVAGRGTHFCKKCQK